MALTQPTMMQLCQKCDLREQTTQFWFQTRQSIDIRAGTRSFKNRRLIEYLKEATRTARLGTRSVLGAAGKVEI